MRIKVKVIPHAKKERIEKGREDFKVYLTEPAQENRANKRLIEVLSEYFKVKKYNISILRCQKHREKIVEIS